MKDLRTIRIFLATLFFIGAVAYLAISETIHPMARIVPEVQIVPSLLASGLGAIVVWFGITFLSGGSIVQPYVRWGYCRILSYSYADTSVRCVVPTLIGSRFSSGIISSSSICSALWRE